MLPHLEILFFTYFFQHEQPVSPFTQAFGHMEPLEKYTCPPEAIPQELYSLNLFHP